VEYTGYIYLIHSQTLEYTHLRHLHCSLNQLLRRPGHLPHQENLMLGSEKMESELFQYLHNSFIRKVIKYQSMPMQEITSKIFFNPQNAKLL
jgi:hypothetical protein